MGFFSLLLYLLAAVISTAAAEDAPNSFILPSQQTSLDGLAKTILTVDCLFCTSTEVEEPPATSSVVVFSASAKASETTICAQRCSVLTLSTVTWKSGMSRASSHTPFPIATSCITIYDSSVPPIHPIPSIPRIPVPFTSTPTSVSASASILTSVSISTMTTTSTSCSTSPATASPWSWSPLSSSSALGVTPWASAETLTTTYDLSGSEPCTTEITVTMTTTIIETWESRTPVTTTLVRTRSTTIETVVLETYSTSTGERVAGGTRIETATFKTVSTGADCSIVDVGNCCAACSETVASEIVESLPSVISGSVVPGTIIPGATILGTTIPGSVITDGGYMSSSTDGSISWTTETWSISPSNTDDSDSDTSETGSVSSNAESASLSGSETVGPTSIQTAGGAQVTAALGIGALFGVMGLLA